MNLSIGQQYKKANFGITLSKQLSEHIVAGELYTFFSENSKYNNIIENDGFVYEGRGEYAIIPKDVKSDLHRHVFLHNAANKPYTYTYLGKGLYEKRYDDKHNKIYFKEESN
jgi:hypothetical protein